MLTPDFTFAHSVTLEKWKGRGISADEYGAPVQVPCRVNLKRVYAVSGGAATAVVVANGTVFMPADTDVHEKDRLTFMGNTYLVSAVQPSYDWLGGLNHIEVEIK